MVVMFSSCSFAQMRINNREQAEQLLKKGKIQQIAGIIISGVGLTGSIIAVNSFKPPELATLTHNLKTTCFTAIGISITVVGIVYLISGSKKIKKANLFLNSEHLGITPEFKSGGRLVSIGVRLNI